MSDQLTESQTPGDGSIGHRSELRTVLIQVGIVLLAFASVGALCGLLWWHLWTPPTGTVSDHQWFTDEEGLRGEFSSTGLYVVIAVGAGLLVGALTAFFLDRAELVTLAAVVVGSALAAWLMFQVGLHYSPSDPNQVAETAKDETLLRGHLFVAGKSPFAAFPVGALTGLAIVFLGAAKRRRGRD